MTGGTEPSIDVEELHARVTQLEETAQEAHIKFRERIVEQDSEIEAQQEEIRELRDGLTDAREEIRRLEQDLVRLRE